MTEPFAAPPTTDQVAAVLAFPVTVALKACELPSCTDAADGATETAIVGTLTTTETVLPVTAPGPGWRTAN